MERALLRLGHRSRKYEDWIRANDTLSLQDITAIDARIKKLPSQPLISLVLELNAPSISTLRGVLDSVFAQLYRNWELRIEYTNSAEADCRALLESCATADSRIKLVAGGVGSLASARNAALDNVTGDFIGYLEQFDQLAPHALYLIVEEINSNADASLIYTDEDRIDDRGRRCSPRFKTEWNPDLLLSQHYFGNLTIYRRELIERTRFRPGFEGSEDYDFALRAIEQVGPATIRHVPYVLVHRKLPREHAMIPSVAASARRALEDHFKRLGISATVEPSRSGYFYRVRRLLPAVPPRVSIIVPTRDRVELLRGLIDGVLMKTTYPDYEIVIVDNQSTEPETLSYFASIAEHPLVRILRFDSAFNYSAINNFAARQCQSPILAFLNNDLLIISDDWLSEMVSQALRPEVGAVGAMLYYPNDTIQHAGIITGFGGVAVNCYNSLERGSTGYCNRTELIQNYSAVTAACLLTRAEIFSAVGGFNERDLPVAFNDVDYCLRLREQNYLIAWTPYAELYHLESVSRGDDMAPGKIERYRRDQAFMNKRWGHVLSNDPYYSPNLSLDEKPFALSALPRLRRPWKANVGLVE